MRKRILGIVVLLCMLGILGVGSYFYHKAGEEASFSICFLDVGQGDAALVECDGHYMLIDGGDIEAGDKVYETLKEQGVRKLDILVISHLHLDHMGGLNKALEYTTSVGLTLSNSAHAEREVFRQLERQLEENGSQITVPAVGDTYQLGSATIEVLDVSTAEENDSLVLMITYGDTRFLFTGDIEEAAQTRICDRYENESDEAYDIDLIKMPHHGSYTGSLYRFLRTFMPEYAVISAGEGNDYGHPHGRTLELLENDSSAFEVYRTDKDGDILVKSDGKWLFVEEE